MTNILTPLPTLRLSIVIFQMLLLPRPTSCKVQYSSLQREGLCTIPYKARTPRVTFCVYLSLFFVFKISIE